MFWNGKYITVDLNSLLPWRKTEIEYPFACFNLGNIIVMHKLPSDTGIDYRLNINSHVYPCKESDADIGMWIHFNDKSIGFHWGRFELEISKKGVHYCNYFATGCGG